MQSPLSIYKKVAKEFGVTSETDAPSVGKMSYMQDQVAQQKAILNRLLFDAATAIYHQNEAKDPTTKDAHRKKADDYRNDIRQILSALKLNLVLIDELRKEYPELAVEA
jgi:hypothetical protein